MPQERAKVTTGKRYWQFKRKSTEKKEKKRQR